MYELGGFWGILRVITYHQVSPLRTSVNVFRGDMPFATGFLLEQAFKISVSATAQTDHTAALMQSLNAPFWGPFGTVLIPSSQG